MPVSRNWATIYNNSFCSGTRSQRAAIQVIPPPIQTDSLQPQAQIQQHPHEGEPGVQRPRQQVVVPLPPVPPVSIHHKPRQESDNDPGRVVHGGGWGHIAGGANEDRRVDQFDPFVGWEGAVGKPDEERGNGASQKEPVHGRIGAEITKDAAWANEAPDD